MSDLTAYLASPQAGEDAGGWMTAEFRVRPNGEVQVHLVATSKTEMDLIRLLEQQMVAGKGLWSPSSGSACGSDGQEERRHLFIAARPAPVDGEAT